MADTPKTNEQLIEEAVNRFLAWTLPESFNPDGGISFTKIYPDDMPTGTNLFDAPQAKEMVAYLFAEALNTKDRECAEAVRVAVEEGAEVTENTSDGYHTFKELYEFRKVYNAVLFNEWAKRGLYNVHKSWKHSDGQDCFGGGWFIVVATLPTGDISNHYEAKDWCMFQCEECPLAKEWDGHTAQDTLVRLQSLTTPTETLPDNTKA